MPLSRSLDKPLGKRLSKRLSKPLGPLLSPQKILTWGTCLGHRSRHRMQASGSILVLQHNCPRAYAITIAALDLGLQLGVVLACLHEPYIDREFRHGGYLLYWPENGERRDCRVVTTRPTGYRGPYGRSFWWSSKLTGTPSACPIPKVYTNSTYSFRGIHHSMRLIFLFSPSKIIVTNSPRKSFTLIAKTLIGLLTMRSIRSRENAPYQ